MTERAFKGNLYVAASSAEVARAAGWIKQMRGSGWNITYDWTQQVEQQGTSDSMSLDARRKIANVDTEAVLTADILWVLMPTTGGAGVHTELGIAIGANRLAAQLGVDPIRIVVSGFDARNVFAALADDIFETDDVAFEALNGW